MKEIKIKRPDESSSEEENSGSEGLINDNYSFEQP